MNEFKELMDIVKERNPDLIELIEEMEQALTEKEMDEICMICRGNSDKKRNYRYDKRNSGNI